jgi:hydroxymethylglutaryl-CoA reductase (NADPH)
VHSESTTSIDVIKAFLSTLPIANMTLGMRLDSAIEQLDSLSSTQLYVLIVGVTIVASFLVLGTSQPPPEPVQEATANSACTTSSVMKSRSGNPSTERTQTSKSNLISKRSTPKDDPDAPEPKWHIFTWVNTIAVILFVLSVVDFTMHASVYLKNDTNDSSSTVLKFLLGWSILLCYFFGFFGISFVHDMTDDIPGTEPIVNQTMEQTHHAKKLEHENDNYRYSSVSKSASHTLNACDLHPPCDSTVPCADPTVFVKPSAVKMSGDEIKQLSDREIVDLVHMGKIKDHELEKLLDPHRAVEVRRIVVNNNLSSLGYGGSLQRLPYKHDLDYGRVFGANCEIVIGYVPIPVGIIGPLTLNGQTVYVPMATTEGCLVASTNRGAKAITQGSGAYAVVTRDGITRAPCVRMCTARDAAALKIWCEVPENFLKLKASFESTTSFGKLKACVPTIAGKNVYLRLTCFSGDAMGMNMVSKGSLAVIETLKSFFPSLQLVALSGNMCTDKKAAATNWIEGRGKSVVVEATIPKDIVRTTLKTSVKGIVDTNLQKNLIGSAMACTIGGFNAHASNIVTAVFLATGQDPAQNVESSNCITIMEEDDNGDLWISCTMPSLEVGTVGGGTSLPAQASCLDAMGCKGGSNGTAPPGSNAQQLAMIVAAATMAGELSLLAALAANTLVSAHMQHNRKPQPVQ